MPGGRGRISPSASSRSRRADCEARIVGSVRPLLNRCRCSSWRDLDVATKASSEAGGCSNQISSRSARTVGWRRVKSASKHPAGAVLTQRASAASPVGLTPQDFGTNLRLVNSGDGDSCHAALSPTAQPLWGSRMRWSGLPVASPFVRRARSPRALWFPPQDLGRTTIPPRNADLGKIGQVLARYLRHHAPHSWLRLLTHVSLSN